MHDTEPDTFVPKTWPDKVCDMLKGFDVDCQPNEIASGDVENDDYYSRYFSQTPRMVTNKGSLEVKNSNIDVIQIIQKG
jgi:hypothetical protein